MKKKLTALLLALAMVLALLTGCAKSESAADSSAEAASSAAAIDPKDDPVLSAIDAGALVDVVDYLTDGALKATDVVLTVDGAEVTAASYLHWVAYPVSSMSQTGLTEEQLDTKVGEGDQTIAEFLKQNAMDYAAYYQLTRQEAQAAGLELDDTDRAQMEEFSANLPTVSMLALGTTAEAQRELYESYLLGQKLQDKLYGGDNAPSDEDIHSYALDQGYYTCRYVLFPLKDGEGKELDGEKQKAECKKVYDALKETPADKLEETFQTYQEKYNTREKGADGNTDAFTSSTGSVVGGFADVVSALGDNELGMTEEETEYGYFVILRLPLDLDENTLTNLRNSYAGDTFDHYIQAKVEEAKVEFTPLGEAFDAKAFCLKLSALQQQIMEAQAAQAQAEAEAAAADSSAAESTEDIADSSAE